jgi:hypothetical protein
LEQLARGLAKTGFKEKAVDLLSSVELITDDLVWQERIQLLAACGHAERAIAVSRDYLARAEVYSLDKMEALGKLGEMVSKKLARDLIVGLASEVDSEVTTCARAAELLHSFEFKAEARSILFRLVAHSVLDADDAFWIAYALHVCDLPLRLKVSL